MGFDFKSVTTLFSRDKRRREPTNAPKPGLTQAGSRGTLLPLGVDISDTGIGIAAIRMTGARPTVIYARWTAFTGGPNGRAEDIAAAVSDAFATIGSSQRQCVLCVRGVNVAAQLMQNKGLRDRDALSMGRIRADKLVKYPAAERVVTVDRVDGLSRLVCVTRRTLVNECANAARVAGLRPIAVEIDWSGWARALKGEDAVLDVRGDVPQFIVFPRYTEANVYEPGHSYNIPAGPAGRLTEEGVRRVGQILLDLRREQGVEVSRVAVASSRDADEQIEALQTIAGIEVHPAIIGGVGASWGLALGLAQRSIRSAGTFAVNLLEDRADIVRVFGLRLHESVTRQLVRAGLGTAAAVCAILVLQGVRYGTLAGQLHQLTAEDGTLAAQLGTAHDLGKDIGNLEGMSALAASVRASGNTQAVSIAQVGSAVRTSPKAWLTSLSATGNTWLIQGTAPTLEALSAAIVGLQQEGIFKLSSFAQNQYDGSLAVTSLGMPSAPLRPTNVKAPRGVSRATRHAKKERTK